MRTLPVSDSPPRLARSLRSNCGWRDLSPPRELLWGPEAATQTSGPHRPTASRHGTLLHAPSEPGTCHRNQGPRRGLAGKYGEGFADSTGQRYAKRALEVAAAGEFNTVRWEPPASQAREYLDECSLGQPGTSSLALVPWRRSHSDACSGWMVSLTTPSTSVLNESRSVSSRNLELKAASVFAASYFLR
jgi:hypothetical protein